MAENFRDEPIRSQKVLRSAKGQACTYRFPGICGGGTETTVWSHLNGGRFGKGMGQKAHDILGAHACFWCHQYLDFGHGTKPMISDEVLLECVLGGVTETWVRLIRAGIVMVPLDPAPKPRAVKPKAERPPSRPIQNRANAWPPAGSRKIESRNNLRRHP